MSVKRHAGSALSNDTPELQEFASQFRDEAHLRQVTAQLLGRMKYTGVTITHGMNEKGKDIIFYEEAALDVRRLNACVVKNERITGTAGALSGAGTVFQQALQALAEPHVNRSSGQDEKVFCVYVISPYTCAPAAIDSIKSQLQEQAGRVEFKCGREFMELFTRHWPDLLRFESGLLTRYVASLVAGLEQDPALNAILARQNVDDEARSLASVYVQPTLRQELVFFSLANLPTPQPGDLSRAVRLADLDDLQVHLHAWGSVLQLASLWTTAQRAAEAEHVGQQTMTLAPEVRRLWEQRYRMHEQIRTKEQQVKRLKREVRLDLEPSSDLMARYDRVARWSQEAFQSVQERITSATSFARQRHGDRLKLLEDNAFLDYCRVDDLARLLPTVIERGRLSRHLEYGPDLLDRVRQSVLITGPAGFGKTSYCRWHALQDAGRLTEDPQSPLPIYVRLHQYAQRKLGSFEETFFAFPELRELLQRRGDQGRDRLIRLYLDGLDEVPSRRRQEELVELAREGLTRHQNLQLVITAREHVWGPWLGWLPRVRLAELDEAGVRKLVKNWLRDDAQIEAFFAELAGVPALGSLMAVPLLGTLIVNLYRQTRGLPPTKPRLYRSFVDLFSGGWDAAKQVHRGGRFGPEDKITVLTRLATLMHYSKRRDATEDNFKAAIRATLASFETTWQALLDEVLQDGLLVRSGAVLTFCHHSFQEYLAARDLQSDPTGSKPNLALRTFLRGDDWWREVLAFYIGGSGAPQEIHRWICKVAGETQRNASNVVGGDFGARVRFLEDTLVSSFPGFEPKTRVARS